MQSEKKPQRQCIAAESVQDKQDLIRRGKTKEGEICLTVRDEKWQRSVSL